MLDMLIGGPGTPRKTMFLLAMIHDVLYSAQQR